MLIAFLWHAPADGTQKFLAELIVTIETTGEGLGIDPLVAAPALAQQQTA
jgi:hypothetical protein